QDRYRHSGNAAEGRANLQRVARRGGGPQPVGLLAPARQSREIRRHPRLPRAPLQRSARPPDAGDRTHLAIGAVRKATHSVEKTLTEFEAAIKRCPNVLSCHLMSGEYDYILRIAAKDLADYERIHKQWLSAMPHVTKINSSFALREVIDRTALGLKPEIA